MTYPPHILHDNNYHEFLQMQTEDFFLPLDLHAMNNSIPGEIPVFIQLEEEEKEKTNCAICLENLESIYNQSMVSPCLHFFCSDCLDDWIKHACRTTTCPLCRSKCEEVVKFIQPTTLSEERNSYPYLSDYLVDIYNK